MTVEEAKNIGSRQALKSVGIGLLIAQVIMTLLSSGSGFLKGFLWFTDISYKLNLTAGIIIMLLCGYYCGRRAGFEILIKKLNYNWVGFKYGIITLMAATFLASWIGFFQEGIQLIGTGDNPYNDYIFKPLFWVFVFGLLPVIFVGFWFGRQIKTQEIK
jgi:hypothetical protein